MRGSLTVLTLLALVGCGADESTASDNAIPRAGQPAPCPDDGVAMQVLGSGGPIAEGAAAARAGTSYLLWIDGEPRLLVDAGSGSFLRFAEAGASIGKLDAILLTHLHADHTGDLIDVLNSGGFEGRSEPLIVAGPSSAPRFPSTSEFLQRLLAKDGGAFAYNGGYLDGTENKPKITAQDIPFQDPSAQYDGTGFDPHILTFTDDLFVLAFPVHHGPVPAVGYWVQAQGKVFVITGDQSGMSSVFYRAMANEEPDILFAHHVINGEEGQPIGLHRTPEQIGELAGKAGAKRLVLTHNMQRSLERLDEGFEAIGNHYKGPVSVADDLDCYAL